MPSSTEADYLRIGLSDKRRIGVFLPFRPRALDRDIVDVGFEGKVGTNGCI